MSVVRREARRRWALVGAGVAALCLLPALIAARPGPGTRADPAQLRELIMASATRPYQGYVDVQGHVGLPDLPALGSATDLFSGGTRMRAWYASPDAWRVAVFTATGEADTYRTPAGTYHWDFENNLLTQVTSEPPARLPRAADLQPPDLARRLLSAGSGAFSAIPAKRVAGVAAAGLRLTPSDPDTTVGRVDVWADPDTGLPLRVEIAGRAGPSVLTSRFLDLTQRSPDPGVIVPHLPDGAGYALASGVDVADALNGVSPIPLPTTLAGRSQRAGPPGTPLLIGLGLYGSGFATFAAVALPGRVGSRSLEAIRESGGAVVPIAGSVEAYELGTSLVNALIVRTPGDRGIRRTYLLVGSVPPDLLRRAGTELMAEPPEFP